MGSGTRKSLATQVEQKLPARKLQPSGQKTGLAFLPLKEQPRVLKLTFWAGSFSACLRAQGLCAHYKAVPCCLQFCAANCPWLILALGLSCVLYVDFLCIFHDIVPKMEHLVHLLWPPSPWTCDRLCRACTVILNIDIV